MSLRWLPNAISIARIIMVVPILLFIVDEKYGTALILFFIAGLSDGVDGYLAKTFDWHTRIGALLDPIADKLLVGGTFITMFITGLVPVWLAALVLLRDVVIIGGATAYNYFVRPVEGEPTRISKLNTALQLMFIVFVLSHEGYGWPDSIAITVIGAGVLVTLVVSGIDYVWSWTRRARADASGSPESEA